MAERDAFLRLLAPRVRTLPISVVSQLSRVHMIIAEQQDGHWTAWQDVYPCLSFGGDTAAAAACCAAMNCYLFSFSI